MFVGEDVGDRVHLAGRHLLSQALVQYLGPLQRRDPVADDAVDLVARGQPLALLAPYLGRGEFGSTHGDGQALEHLVGGAGDGDPLVVLGAEVAVRAGHETARPFAFAHLAVQPVHRGQFFEHAEHGFVDADVDDLPAAGGLGMAQRHEHADGAEQAGDVVAQRHGARQHRCFTRVAGQVVEPREGLRDVRKAMPPAVRAGLAVAGHAQHHQLGVGLAQCVPRQAPALHRAGAEVLDQHIGLGDELQEQLHALGLQQVDRHRALVAALAEPRECGVRAFGGGAEAAHRVATDRVFDLDDVGPELAHDGSGIRAGQEVADIDHAHAGERLRRGRFGGRRCVGHVMRAGRLLGRQAVDFCAAQVRFERRVQGPVESRASIQFC